MIQVPAVLERCAGIDIGKRRVAVATIVGPADAEGEVEVREYGTTVPQLEELKKWLIQKSCTSVAMESTGPYWIPVKNVLEGHVKIVLVCPRKYPPPKGEKTDFRDARHLAHLHRHGLLTGSFLPAREIVELRDLTRRRKKLLGTFSSEKNRIQKVLESANVKLGNVASDVFGVSGQEILATLLTGKEVTPEGLAGMAKAKLRHRMADLAEALTDHQMTEHHRWLIRQSVDHAIFLDVQLEDLEKRIDEKLKPFQKQRDLLETIPGIKGMTSAAILAEIGPTMEAFASSEKLAFWAGICPGNNRTAGKNKSSKIKKGNKFLLSALVQAGKAASRSKGTIFQKKYYRFMKTLGAAKASVAIGHALLTVVYEVLSKGQPYREASSPELQERERQKLVRHHARRLKELGADETKVSQIVEEIQNQPLPQPPPPPADAPAVETATDSTERETKTSPGRIRRGQLGFRARQTRSQKYSVVKHQPDAAPASSEGQSRPKTTKPKSNQKTESGHETPKTKTKAKTKTKTANATPRSPSGEPTPRSSRSRTFPTRPKFRGGTP